MSITRLICDGWEFCKNPIETDYESASGWKPVDIPHDWLIYQVKDLYETSTGWYKRTLNVTKKEGMRTAVRFEGVYMDSRVYVNGKLAGEWKYGYSTFEFDITDLLRDGDNLLTVRVDYRSPNSRWYSGAGIYRRVWLKEYPECHLTSDGIYISGNTDGTVTVTAEAERPAGFSVNDLALRCTVLDGGREIASVTSPCCAADKSTLPDTVTREGCAYSVNISTLHIPEPVLWDIDDPHLYLCRAELIRDGNVIDCEESSFGLRKIEFTTDKGFFLNGRHLKIHGCCMHHDLGALGAAVNKNALARQLRKIREMGANAVRTSHNMPSTELMELADEMGFLILSEGFDMWERQKTDYDYARFFLDWVHKDVSSWVRRDRNHPSIIGWSIGNEIYDTHADDRGQEVTSLLMSLVRKHDPRGNGYVTIGSNYMQWDNAQKCADILKIAGYNYAERLYSEHHEKYPDWCIYGSETASVLQSRGIYHFPLSQSVLADDDEQCSALGNTTAGWAAKNTEACIIPDRDAEFCAGQFIWTGFDYIGEPTPYSTKNSYFGQIDTAGFFKDSAYIFQAEWTDVNKAPFVHIYPYWDFSKGQKTDVRITSNAPTVKLLRDGIEIASKEIDHLHGTELTLNTVLDYSPGELTAIAYNEKGEEVARDSVCSFGNGTRIRLTAENDNIRADGQDLIFLDIEMEDSSGNLVANANNRVFVDVTGEGRLIGLDNGDSTDYDEYKGLSRRLFSGKLLAIIAATDKAGEIKVKVTSAGLPQSEITLTSIPSEITEGISFNERNTPMPADCPDERSDIPVRKIEFSADSLLFTPDRKEITVNVKVLPENASYKEDIEYRITTVLGIPSNLAEIVSSENGSVTVRCKGDGEFYLRALCKNGTDKYHILSSCALTGEGLGAASFNPYELVTAGLFTVQSGNIGNGIERGACFADENSWLGFENVDFGSIGSNRVTVPIFANCTTPVRIRFYDGIPGQGGELLGDFEYFKQPVWLTYIPETYTLNKTLTGMHTFVMESSDGYNIKGFFFEKPIKERAEIFASNADSIYGDKFTKGENEVTGIGNNVMLNFGEFDFTEYPIKKAVITGKSALPKNSIHIIFKGAEETRVLAEFEGAADYTPREFSIEGITGKCSVSFAFLPGSDFDFKSFRFE